MTLANTTKKEDLYLKQLSTPYFSALKEYIEDKILTFHCPGHQQGKGTIEFFHNFIKENALACDITQILGMDDLHQPQSIIKEAQGLAALAYGADDSYFLINGSSSGNQAMIMSICNPGDYLILPRNAHKSVTNALILSGVIPVYLQPEFDEEMYVDHTITIESLEKALKSCPHAKAVFILSPTYYGATAPLKEIVELAHSYGKIIMVDEAWGPHLNFHPGLPISAMQAGADICVNSTHKLISGISQGSMLHVKGKAIDRGKLQAVLRIFLSTSPNSLIIASLDVARMQMMIDGEKLLEKTLNLANWARDEINKIPGFKAYGKEIIGHPGVDNLDLTRLTFSAKNLNFSGYEIEKILRNKYKIQIELSDLFNVIALITIGHSQEDLNYLIKALNDLAGKEKNTTDINSSKLFFKKIKESIILPEYPPLKLSPREAFFAPFETITFKNSNRYISAELVTPYPPGIPILCPGEEITQEIIDYIEMELKAGIHIQGPVDQNLNTIRVVR